MKYTDKGVEGIKIAYVGGGSRGWAWGLMSDLASAKDISGEVALYDIDLEAAKNNEIIGNKFNDAEGTNSKWSYKATSTLEEALTGADFVVISILPGTFDEMASDVHTPEKYGIYQSVGDTAGPGGIIRALRTLPMIQVIANGIKNCCPNAWVINYTNPMTVITRMLYKVFPEIKAFGCCHEVFGTQRLLAAILSEEFGFENIKRQDIKVNVIGVNHFTWLTSAKYKDIDIFPVYKKYAKKYAESGFLKGLDDNWMNSSFSCTQKVKFDLFNRYGYIAAAGDRHLAEFCNGEWYLAYGDKIREKWGFALTTVDWRKENLGERLAKSERLRTGEEAVALRETGEDGVNQIRALLGLDDMITNVNLPNRGQIPNLPMDAVVETNACFRDDSLDAIFAGEIPESIFNLVARASSAQELIVEAAYNRDLELAFNVFANDPLVTLPLDKARELFDEMVENTKEYLTEYFK